MVLQFFGKISVSQKKELVVQTGHSLSINSLVFSPDGNFLVSCGNDNIIILWDVLSGKQIRTFKGHTAPVNQIVFHPGSELIASISEDNTIRLWDIKNSECIKTLASSKGKSLDFNNNGNYLIASGYPLILWKCKNWQEKDNKIIADTIIVTNKSFAFDYIKFCHNSNVFAVSNRKKGDIIIYNIDTERIERSYSLKCNSLAFSPNDQYLAAAGIYGKLRRWDLNSNIQFVTRYSITEKKWIDSYLTAEISENGEFFAGGNQNNMINIFNIKNGKTHLIIKGHTSDVTSLTFSPDNNYMASAGKDRKIYIWDIKDGQLVKTIKGMGSRISCMDTNNDRILIGNAEGYCKLIEIGPNGKSNYIGINVDILNRLLRWQVAIDDVCFMHDTLNILIKSRLYKESRKADSSRIKYKYRYAIWNTATDKISYLKPTITGNKYLISDYIIYKLKNKQIEKICRTENKNEWSFRKFDFINNQINLKRINGIWLSKNEKVLITSKPTGENASVIELFDIKTGKNIFQQELSSGITSVEYLPFNNRLIIALSKKQIKIYNTENNRIIYNFNGLPPFAIRNNHFACLEDEKTLKIIDLSSGDAFNIHTTHSNTITSINWLKEDNKIITGSNDGTIKLLSLESKKELGSIIPVETDNIVYVTPQNYYMATKGALRGVGFSIDKKILAFDQFDIKYNRPDIVYKHFELAEPDLISLYAKAYEKRLRILNIDENELSDNLTSIPNIRIENKDIPIYSNKDTLSISITAWDDTYYINRIFISINGVPVHGSKGLPVNNKTQTWQGEIPVKLCKGNNIIKVFARNNKGVNSLKQQFEIFYKEHKIKPDLYIVAIGVSKYKDEKYNLLYAQKDAEDLTRLFLAQKNDYNKIILDTLFDQYAIRENILKAKKGLLKTNVDDVVIIYASGHGLLDDNLDYYFATYDVNFNNPGERGLAYESLEYLLDSIPARKKLMLIDACHSGEVDKDEVNFLAMDDNTESVKANVKAKIIQSLKDTTITYKKHIGLKNSFELMKELFADLRRNSGAVVISSAAGLEYAYEDNKWQNGAFTYCLIEGLRTGMADLNKDKKIMVSELQNYISERVQYLTNKRQNPTVRSENLEFDFQIW